MRHVSISIVIAVACASACGPSDPGAGSETDGGAPIADGGAQRCTEGDRRCAGGQYQTCVEGAYQNQERCEHLCADDLGCIDCDPALGNACSGSDVVRCNADGSYGT